MCHHLLLLRVSGRFSAQVAPFVTPTAWFVLASAISFYPTTQLRAADPPATPEKAAEVIDFTKFELVRPLESDAVLNRRIAGQSYIATGTVNEIAGELSLSVSPSGKPDEVRVFLMNHGNVDYKGLPLPAELTPQFQTPVMSMLGSPWTVEETTEKISQALTGDDWTPYGSPVGSRQFKQNGVRLNVSVFAAPAQNNRTIVQVSAEQMSADIPVPDGSENIQYSDSTCSVSFDHAASISDNFASIRSLLESRGWDATTKAPIKISFREHFIFRDSSGDMMEVMCHEIDGKTRTRIDFSTSAEVKELDQAVAAEAAHREAEMAKQSIKEVIVVTKPAGSEITETEESQIEFSIPSGKALTALGSWASALEKEGWKRTTNVQEKMAGDFTLKKGDIELHVTYVDPGILPASIYLSIFGKATLKVKP